jgi:hypothetical protein
MRKLLAILALLLSPALYGQEYVNPYANATQTVNLVPDFSFDGPTNSIPDGWTSSNPPGMGGSIQPSCGALSDQGKCFVFSFGGTTLSTLIDLSQYQTNSFEFYFDFYYRMNCNNSIGGYCENPDGPRDLFGASVQFFTTNGEAGAFNFIPIGPDYFKAGDQGVNEFDYRAVGWYSSQQSEFLFTSAIISFYGQDTGFWAGPYGPALDRVNFSIGYLPPPEEPIAVDCAIYPYDQTCIIQDLTDFTDITDETLLADTTEETGSDDGSDDGSEIIEEDEEILLADEDIIEGDLEELLADETIDETLDETANEEIDEEVLVENNATYRELSDEEKAAILADAISKTTLEGALAIANDATTSNTVSSTSSSNENTNVRTTSTSSVTQETTIAENRVEETKTENTDTSNNDALDILETGRSLGQQALANTLEQTKESANDSINQAESIANASNESGNTSNTITSTIDNDTESVIASIGVGDVIDDAIIDNAIVEQNTETTETFVADTTTTTQSEINDSDSFADIMNIDIGPTTEKVDQDTEFVNQLLAETNKQEEQNTSGFNEDEQVTIQNDPALANAFNVVPNTTNLELLGVIGKSEDKSDAEKRSEEIVAANKEQQDEINNNYMDADQSGLIGAIAGDTDVTSYRTAMIPDLSSWYKPEDIYKNVVYKDNARGMYFLEKGNTDTYKQMVEEQYK